MGTNSIETLKKKIKEFEHEIVNNINISFNESLSHYMDINKKKIILKWKNSVLNLIFCCLDRLIKMINELDLNKKSNTNNSYDLLKYEIQKIENFNNFLSKKQYKNENIQALNDLGYKDCIKIQNKKQLDYFTSKNIEDENKEITRIFQKEAYNYMNSEEEIENKNVAYFLKNVAEISRKSYSEANLLFKSYLEKFNTITNKKIITLEKEEDKKEFSSWVKKYEKNNNFPEDKNKKADFLTDLNSKLKIMYFHCKLSFPCVEIIFEKEEKFNSEKMIDFINRGPKRKVNFIVLPSLFSNENFLQNGKSWVFTYNKNTFKFEDSEIKNLK